MEKQDVKSMTLARLTEAAAEWGLPRFRAAQLYEWLHVKRATDFTQMTNLPATLRTQLEQTCYISALRIEKKLVSALDGTVKYLFAAPDGNCVEAVLMHYHHGNSLCISTQVGCRMGCRFCASTIGGLVRNLTAAEMLDEIYLAEQDSGMPIGSLVLMGIGEPLDNFENLLDFLEILRSPQGRNLGSRHVSLSTCGLVDQIDRLAERKLQLTLSVSLHAPNDTIRTASMPINNKYNISTLLAACRRYFHATGRRVSFEYALIAGVNDAPQHAQQLAGLLGGMGAHVNLIPVNPVTETGYTRGDRETIEAFRAALERLGINATVRRTLGADIAAACGQLRRESAGEKEENE